MRIENVDAFWHQPINQPINEFDMPWYEPQTDYNKEIASAIMSFIRTTL